MVSIYVLGWLFYEEDLPHPRLAAGTTMLQSKPMRPLSLSPSLYLEWLAAQRVFFPVIWSFLLGGCAAGDKLCR
jgi:hypothetical protein